MATVYHREQAGFPGYADGVDLPGFTALKTILKACLVTGYGAKPAAGWELVAEGTYHIVLRNGSHTGYLSLTRTSSSHVCTVHVMETFTSHNGTVPAGSGLKTGIAANNAVPHKFQTYYLANPTSGSAHGNSWFMVADNKTFNLCMLGGYSTPVNWTSGWDTLHLYAGEDSAGNFVAVGGEAATGNSPYSLFDERGMTALKNPATGLLVDTGSIAPYIFAPKFYGQISDMLLAAPPVDRVEVAKCRWGASGAYAGALRGCALAPSINGLAPNAACGLLGREVYTYRNAHVPFPSTDGRSWYLAPASNRSAIAIVTDAPEFW